MKSTLACLTDLKRGQDGACWISRRKPSLLYTSLINPILFPYLLFSNMLRHEIVACLESAWSKLPDLGIGMLVLIKTLNKVNMVGFIRTSCRDN